jgi:hypothetical protein
MQKIVMQQWIFMSRRKPRNNCHTTCHEPNGVGLIQSTLLLWVGEFQPAPAGMLKHMTQDIFGGSSSIRDKE